MQPDVYAGDDNVLHGEAKQAPLLPPQLICFGLIAGPILSAALIWTTHSACIEGYTRLGVTNVTDTDSCPESPWVSAYRTSTPVLVMVILFFPYIALFSARAAKRKSSSMREILVRGKMAS